ncbi:MAG TPA: helix-turn-helix domain-containing protein [bacterium]|nr:helix-turn-helix domain-containing protein [bacterium]
MKEKIYKKLFASNRLRKLGREVAQKVQRESALITNLPSVGVHTFLKYIEENYKDITKDKKTEIIFFEIVKENTDIKELSNLISKHIRAKLEKGYTKELGADEAINYLLEKGKRLLIIINRIERIAEAPETLSYLETLRAINLYDVRFLLGSSITSIVNPRIYKGAGMVTGANLIIIPPYSKKEFRKLIKVYKEVFGWKTPIKFVGEIYKLSGGFPGIAKYVIKYINESELLKLNKEDLLNEQTLIFKLENIVHELKINGLIKNNELNLEKIGVLKEIGIVTNANKLKVGLLESFLKTRADKDQVKEFRKELSAQEYKLYKFVEKTSPKLVTLDEIAKEIWGKNASTKYSMWAMYKLISNVNKKIGKIGYEIKNYRGRGYTLVSK